MIKKFIYAFLLLCLMPCQVFASVASTKDKRRVIGWVGEKPEYVDNLSTTANIWNTAKYNNYVCIGQGKGCSSGEFISPKHILTNAHVAEGCGTGGVPECTIQTSDKKVLSAKVVFSGWTKLMEAYTNDIPKGKDWSILEITTPNFCSKHYFGYVKPTPVEDGMWRAGFGQLRVMTDEEFDAVRKAYTKALLKNSEFGAAVRVAKQGVEIDYGDLGSDIMVKFQEEFSALTGKNFVKDFLYDLGTIKMIPDCAILEKASIVRHSCRTWFGDSGSSINNKSNQITLLVYGARPIIGGTKHEEFGVPTENIFSKTVSAALTKAKENCGKEPMSQPDAAPSPDKREIGEDCMKSDLPPHATAGHYIKSGSKKLDCANGNTCSCAATQCESNYYLVVNSFGNSQGWCYKRSCPTDKHLNIIDGYKTDTICIDN